MDHRSDVYSLGATLYSALTATVPFGGSSESGIADRVRQTKLPSIRGINISVSVDLQTVCEIALEIHPDDRFASAERFADELNRAIAGLPLRCKPPSVLQRANRWVLRNRTVSAAIATATSLLIIAVAMFANRPAYLTLQIEPADAMVQLDDDELTIRVERSGFY